MSVVVYDPTGERASAFCSALAGWCNVLSAVLHQKTRSSSKKEGGASFSGSQDAFLGTIYAHEADSCIEIKEDCIARIEQQLDGIGAQVAIAPEPPLHPATRARAAFLSISRDAHFGSESSNTSSAYKDPEHGLPDAAVQLSVLASDTHGYSSSGTELERATQGLPDGWVVNPRVAALCVGIDAFRDLALPNLENCCNDARAMTAEFRTLPMSNPIVHCGENVDRATFFRLTREFQVEISAHAKHLEVVVVFLASHGFQFGTKLYLATTDTISASSALTQEFRDGDSTVSGKVERWLQGNCIDVDHVITSLRSTWSGPLAIIVDACRTAPIPELAFKPSELTNSMSYAKSTLLCLSTESSCAAADGYDEGSHSPFCLALLESLFCVGVPLMMSVNKACSSLGSLQQPVLASIQFPEVQLLPKLCQIYFLHADDETTAEQYAWFVASLKRACYRVQPHPEDVILVCSGSLDFALMTVLLELKVGLLQWSSESEPENQSEVLGRIVRTWEECTLRRG
jgi:hypothetical protein